MQRPACNSSFADSYSIQDLRDNSVIPQWPGHCWKCPVQIIGDLSEFLPEFPSVVLGDIAGEDEFERMLHCKQATRRTERLPEQSGNGRHIEVRHDLRFRLAPALPAFGNHIALELYPAQVGKIIDEKDSF